MYYQNGNYMQDLNYYNQMPNAGYNPYAPNNYSNPNMGMNNVLPMNGQNLSAMYPAVYRIILPVVSQVLANNNTGYLTENALNSMVDTVYKIVEGDINLNSQSAPQNTSNDNSGLSSNSERSSTTSRQNAPATSTAAPQNPLLKDLIKIMILNEITSRRQNNYGMMPNNMPNANMTQPMFM